MKNLSPILLALTSSALLFGSANSKDTSTRRQGIQRVGVAIAERPFGPFKPEPNFIPDIPPSIDPCVLVDPKDGSAYL